jgi:hypothetical protein
MNHLPAIGRSFNLWNRISYSDAIRFKENSQIGKEYTWGHSRLLEFAKNSIKSIGLALVKAILPLSHLKL